MASRGEECWLKERDVLRDKTTFGDFTVIIHLNVTNIPVYEKIVIY